MTKAGRGDGGAGEVPHGAAREAGAGPAGTGRSGDVGVEGAMDATAALATLRSAVEEGRGADGDVLEATAALRRSLEEALTGRRLTEGSVLLARAQRVRDRLDALERALADGRADDAATELDEVGPLHAAVVEEARALPKAPVRRSRTARLPPSLRNVDTVAWKEAVVVLQGGRGLVLLGLFLLTFGIGLEAAIGEGGLAGVQPSVALAWTYAHSLDFFSVPLAGLLVGYAAVNEERTGRTIHFLASKPVTPAGIVLGKWVGMAGALAALVGLSALIVGGVAYAFTRSLGDPGAVVGYVAATYLLALAFGSVALALSTVLDRAVTSLAASFVAYVLLGPAWQNAFLVGQLRDLGATPEAGSILVYLASPFTAWWNWTSELLGPRSEVLGLPVGEPWHAALVEAVERGALEALPFYAQQWFYVLVLLAWCLASVLAGAWVLARRDLV